MEAFGGVLRARRLSRGLTQEELSRLAGVSVRAVRDIERGRVRRPRKDSVRRLAAAVGLDPTALDERLGVDRLEIRLLGPLTVHRADAPVDVGPPRQRCVPGLLGLRQHPAAVALARRYVDAVLAYADLAIAAGLHQGAEEQLRALTAEEPLHEGAHARLMLALAGSGRRAAALDLFAEVRGRLVEEL